MQWFFVKTNCRLSFCLSKLFKRFCLLKFLDKMNVFLQRVYFPLVGLLLITNGRGLHRALILHVCRFYFSSRQASFAMFKRIPIRSSHVGLWKLCCFHTSLGATICFAHPRVFCLNLFKSFALFRSSRSRTNYGLSLLLETYLRLGSGAWTKLCLVQNLLLLSFGDMSPIWYASFISTRQNGVLLRIFLGSRMCGRQCRILQTMDCVKRLFRQRELLLVLSILFGTKKLTFWLTFVCGIE